MKLLVPEQALKRQMLRSAGLVSCVSWAMASLMLAHAFSLRRAEAAARRLVSVLAATVALSVALSLACSCSIRAVLFGLMLRSRQAYVWTRRD